jgi:hypothetical protein
VIDRDDTVSADPAADTAGTVMATVGSLSIEKTVFAVCEPEPERY